MNIYKFVTPSEPITFKAENDKIVHVTMGFECLEVGRENEIILH